MYERILVPTDGSVYSDAAVRHTLTIARAMRSRVVFLSLTEARRALTAQAEPILVKAERSAMVAGVSSQSSIAEGVTADTIVQKALDFDLVVMGSHGRRLLRRMTLGSVTRAVLHRVSRPVLVVRAVREEAD